MLRFNTFRAKKYLRSKFVEGKYLLASEATDLELELIDLLRTQLKHANGDYAVEDSWKVTRVNTTQLLVKPGEAWLEGLPFLMRYGKDHLVSGNLLASGITPQFVTITDDANGGGKLITFNVGGSTPTAIYKVVITAQEQVLTDNDDLFLKNANLTEDTAQKIRLVYKINVVSNSLQSEAPLPYTNDTNQANLVNRIVVSPTPGGNGELLNTTLITGSEQIDGRNVELTVRNDSGIGGGNPIPNGSSDQNAFFNGRLIDSNGTEYHLNAVFNATLSTQVILRVSHEVGQNPPEIINGKPYSLRKRDVFVSDDVNGTPQGKLFYSTALVDFNSSSGITSDSKVTDIRKTDEKDPDFDDETNQKIDFYITNGGTLTLDSTSTLLNWSANLDIINAYGAEQTIAPNTVALLDGGSLTYEVNFAGGSIGRGNQSVTIGTGGSTLLLTGGPDLSQVRIGNVIQATGQFAQITAIDNVAKTLSVSPSVSNTGSATIYRDSFAAGTAPLATKSIVVAVRDGLQVKVAKSLILNAGDSSPLGGASPLVVRQNKNGKLVFGGTWLFVDPLLSWSADAFIQIPGLPDARNRIPAGNISLASSDDVAYVEINRTGSSPATLTVLTASIASLAMTDNTFVIARRTGTSVIVGTGSFALQNNESKPLDEGTSDQTLSLLGTGITRSTASPTYTSNIRGVAAEGLQERLGSLTDSAGDGQEDRSTFMRSDIPITWTGTSLQFQTDIIIEVINTKSGTTTTHTIPFSVVSPLALLNGESAWVSINRLAASETLTVNKSTITPIPAQSQANKDVLVLFKRVDATGVGYLHIPLSKQVINPGQTVRLGASGTGGGGSGLGDDITSLFFNADFTDLFDELPLASSLTLAIDISAGFTDPTLYSVVNQYYRLAYDASKTVTGSTVNMTLSSAPSFTVKAGDILVVGGEARKIVTATSQVLYVIESAFVNIPNPSAQSCTVSEALYTKDINQFAGDGLSNFSVNPAPFQTLLLKYSDSLTDGDKIPDYGVTPHVGASASVDGTNYTPVVIRKQNATDTLELLNTPTSGTNLFLRFFANKASGSGFVNLLNYKAYWQEDTTITNSGAVLNSAYTRGDGVGVQVNCLPPILVGGNTRIRLQNFTYPVGLMPHSSIEVLANGQDLDRFIDATSTPDGAFIEVNPSTVDIIGDFTGTDISLKIRVPVPIIDSGDGNTQNLNAIQEIFEDKFQNLVDQDDDILTAFNGAPGVGQFRSDIKNRASIPDLNKDLLPRMGINRIPIHNIVRLSKESGPNGEDVWGVLNEQFGQLRLVGAWNKVGDFTYGPAVSSVQQDDYIEVVFVGTALNLLYDQVNFNTDLRVSTDGGAEGANINTAAGNASIVLDGRNYNTHVILPVVKGLAYGQHTVKIRSNGNPGTVQIAGLEIITESSQIKVPTGKAFSNSKQLIHPAAESISYNSGFESGVLGTKGGRVLVYLKPDGTVAKAVTPVDATQHTLAATDHSNEEVIRSYNWREFGSARTDDFSFLTTANQNVYSILNDDTTSLVGAGVSWGGAPYQQIDNMQIDDPNDFLVINFVGSGLDVVRFESATGNDTMEYFLDGVSLSSAAEAGFGKIRTFKLASGLPYCSHNIRIRKITQNSWSLSIHGYKVYGPKKPTLPNGAVELADYNVVSNFVPNATTGVGDAIAGGVIRKFSAREVSYVGANWFISSNNTGVAGGFDAAVAQAGQYAEFTFFGTGLVRNIPNPDNAIVQINANGVALNTTNYPGLTYTVFGSVTFDPSTGIMTDTSGSGNSGINISGLPLALYTFRFTNTNGGGNGMHIGALDTITPIHSQKFVERGQLQNTLSIGSQGLGDARKFSVLKDLPENKNWAEVKGTEINPGMGSRANPVPILDMITTVRSKGALFKIDCSATFFTNSGGGTVALSLYVDGRIVGNYSEGQSYTASGQFVTSNTSLVYLPPGEWTVAAFWNIGGGASSMTARSTHRVLTVKEQ